MTNGTIHFELANQDRIRVPKDDDTFVTVKVDVRDITKANQTGSRLLLALDADTGTNAFKGIEAVTAATGDDITTPSAGWGDAVGQDFVIYATELSIAPASTQPSMNLPSTASTEIYRFTVTADNADNAEIGRVTMDLALNGIDFDTAAAFTTQKVVNGTPDNNQTFTTLPTKAVADGETTARIAVSLTGERLAKGESRTYAVFASKTVEVGNSENSDGITVTLLRDTAYATPAAKNSLGVGTITLTAFVEADSAADSALTAGQYNINGTLVDVGDGGVTYDSQGAAGADLANMAAAVAADIAANVTGVTATSNAGVITLTGAWSIEEIEAISPDTAGTDATSAEAITTGSLVLWSDESDPAHSDTTSDWLNGYLMNVDTNGFKLTR